MTVAIITGSGGLVGSESARHFAGLGLDVIGIDNDMRARYFGVDASTASTTERLTRELGTSFTKADVDVRDFDGLESMFRRAAGHIALVIHAAAQPSHDWSLRDPLADFAVNASGTLNLLELARRFAPTAPFIFTSTNKVYGDQPNHLPLEERETRLEIASGHSFGDGVTEAMSIDTSLHTVFGASKAAADLLVQEYGRTYGLPTVSFRCGTLTGPAHAATELHGFLAYLVRCAAEGRTYTVFGNRGKMVRDVLHSRDLVGAFEQYFRRPRPGEVYNMGGGRVSNCSHLEAFELVAEFTGQAMDVQFVDDARLGDHRWWISSVARFRSDYPAWEITSDVPSIIREIYEYRGDGQRRAP